MRQLPEGTSEGTHQRHQESEDLAVQWVWKHIGKGLQWNTSSRIILMIAHLCEFTKNYWIVSFKMSNFMAHELDLD